MVLHVDRNGNEVRSIYNVDGNPVLETGTDRNGENRVTRSFEYDASGNVRKAVAGGFCYTYEYCPDGKLLKKSASGRTLVSCTYFSDGSLESLTDASGKPVFYEYDWRGNLSGVRDENGDMLAAYAHTPGGRLKEIRHGNGLCTRYEYDTDGNMIHLHFQRKNGETISDLWYEYDLNGNRTLKTGKCILSGDSLTDLAVSYRYDSMDRLTSESRDGEETAYSYDFCGNRLKKLDKSGTEEYHYNRKNQLICRFSEKEKTAYRYDLPGNLLEAAGAEGTAVFSYNAFHQQTAMTMPDGKHLENRYDAEYLRAGTVENGTVTTFSYHNGELLAESSPEGDTISRYIPGYGVAAGWNREKNGYHYYHLDEQNSTAYITGRGGEIENRYEYDAFGVLQNSMEEFHNRILYTGQQYDQTSRQYYLRARFYNPVLGRFVQENGYRGDGLNLYAYCKNNPVVYYDPSGYGEEKCDKVGGNDSKSGSSSSKGSNYSDTHEILGPYYDEILEKHKTNPEFYAHPDDYKITEGIEYTNNRAEYTRMVKNGEIEPGHHKLGIADGGKNIQSNITYTGEKFINRKLLPKDALEYYDSVYGTKSNPHPKRIAIFEENGIVQVGKNPKHTEATTLQQKIHIWQKEKGIRK